METSNDKRLVFGAMALFFFVFLESTLFFQTSLGMIVDSAAGSLLQFPIQGASALGLLLFSALNRITAPRIRSTAVGFLTLLGIASLACVAGGTSQALLVGAGYVAFFLIGLAGGAVYWAACNHLRTSAHFATYIGASHALGIVAQIPFFSLIPNRFGEALLLSASIVTLGVVVAKVWPEPTAARRMAVWQARSQNGRIVPYPKLGWKLGPLAPCRRSRPGGACAAVRHPFQHAVLPSRAWPTLDQPILRSCSPRHHFPGRPGGGHLVRCPTRTLCRRYHVLGRHPLHCRHFRHAGGDARVCRRRRVLLRVGHVHHVLYLDLYLDCALPEGAGALVEHGTRHRQHHCHRHRRARVVGHPVKQPRCHHGSNASAAHRHQRPALRFGHARFAHSQHFIAKRCQRPGRTTCTR